jgi:hypothetical protein
MKRAAVLGTCVLALAACGGNELLATATPPPTITPVLIPTAIPLPTADATSVAISTAAAQAALESPLASPLQSPIAAPAGADFSPTERSVWDTSIVGQDQMQGNCTKGSVLPAYGLVQITPFEGGLEWKNQEPKPYEMTRIAANEYQFAGPNSINDGVVTMTVKFVDAQNLTMRREFVPRNDAGCTHVHDYKGVFKWNR